MLEALRGREGQAGEGRQCALRNLPSAHAPSCQGHQKPCCPFEGLRVVPRTGPCPGCGISALPPCGEAAQREVVTREELRW